jgi:hypothetical protein
VVFTSLLPQLASSPVRLLLLGAHAPAACRRVRVCARRSTA